MILKKDDVRGTLSIPDHRTVAKGTLRELISTAELSVEGFTSLLK